MRHAIHNQRKTLSSRIQGPKLSIHGQESNRHQTRSSRVRGPRKPKFRFLAGALLASTLTGAGCAIPHGSNARPVQALKKGEKMVSVGGLIPFAGVGEVSAGDDSADFSGITEGFTVIPAGALDFALDEQRTTFGVELSILNQVTTTEESEGDDALGLFINPRFEVELDPNLSFTIDGNLGYFSSGDVSSFFWSPAVGLRGYLPVGEAGGFVITQQLSSAFVTFAFPGSVAYDFALSPQFHLMPEFRWDPTFFAAGDVSGVIAFFSAGATLGIVF